MDLRFYLSLFLRRLPWFLLFLCAGSAAGLTLARVLPAVYQAQARLVVESEQIPGDLAASTVNTQATEQLQIIQQRILARDRLIEMANRLGIYAGSAEPVAADRMVADLRERIRIAITGGTTRGTAQALLVTVSFEAPTAALAANVTNDVVTQILREDVSMRTTVARQTLDFFEQEVTRLNAELVKQGAAILAFKEANKDALPDSLDFRRTEQTAAQERLLALDRQEAELKERRAQIERLKAAVGEGVTTPGMQASPEQQRLAALRDELAQARAVLAPTHPRVKLLEAQVAAQEKTVAAMAAPGPAPARSRPAGPHRRGPDRGPDRGPAACDCGTGARRLGSRARRPACPGKTALAGRGGFAHNPPGPAARSGGEDDARISGAPRRGNRL